MDPIETPAPEGQTVGPAAGNPPTEGTPAVPAEGTGPATPATQPPTGTETSPTQTPQIADPTFIDPTDLEALEDVNSPAYKRMQAAFTKKMQGLSKQGDAQQRVLDEHAAFMADPVANAQRIIQQYGGGQQPAQSADQSGEANPNGDPLTWDDVYKNAESRIMAKLAPIFQNVQEMRSNNVESQLDQLDPEWRKYEDNMKATMKAHPSMVSDVSMLYRMSVPAEVQETQATQRAMRAFEKKGLSSQVSGKSTVTHSEPGPAKAPKNFQEAVQQAKAKLAREGV